MDEPRLVKIAGRDAWHVYHERRRISTGSADRVVAERFLADFRAALAAPAAGTASISDVLDRYLADRRERAKPGADRLAWAHKALARHLGTKAPDTIDDAACRAYARDRAADGVKPGTVRTELQALSAALRWAAGKGKLIVTAPPVELPPRPAARERWLTRDEADRLVASCRAPHVRLFVLLALNTAARRGAILGLTWDRVDLPGRRIDFRDPDRTATRKRRVPVPINETLAAALTEAKERATTPYVIEWAGGPVEAVKTGFRESCARAKLAGVTPHTLRHTAVTWMMQRGVDPWQVAGFAGMTLDVVQTVYAKHSPEFMADAAKALG